MSDNSRVRDTLRAALAEINSKLLEIDEEARMLLYSLIVGQHAMMVGPPGTAKTALATAVASILGPSVKIFVIQFQADTRVEELFGPIMLSAMKRDSWERSPIGCLPEADYAILDEVSSATSVNLNPLLGILNERLWKNAGKLIKCPLRSAVATGNSWPDEKAFALFDRFLVRMVVRPLAADRSVSKLLLDRDHVPCVSQHVSKDELDQVQAETLALPVSPSAHEAQMEIIRELRKEEIRPSPRRLFQSTTIAQADAWMSGADQVDVCHLESLRHVLWDNPTTQRTVADGIVTKIANPSLLQVNSLRNEAEEVIAKLNPNSLDEAAVAFKKLKQIIGSLQALNNPRAKIVIADISSSMDEINKKVLAGWNPLK